MDVTETIRKSQGADKALATRLVARCLCDLITRYPAEYEKDGIRVSGEDVTRSRDFIRSELIIARNAINIALGEVNLLTGHDHLVLVPEVATCAFHYALDVSRRINHRENTIDVNDVIALADEIQERFPLPDPDETLIHAINGYGQMILTRNRIMEKARMTGEGALRRGTA